MVDGRGRGNHVYANARNTGNAAPSTPQFRLMLFDGFELRSDDRAVRPCPSGQRLAAVLAVRGTLPRSTAAGLLWPDVRDTRALGNLRTALWRLAKSCPGLAVADGDQLALGAVDVDVATFATWANRLVAGAAPAEGDVAFARAGRAELLPGWYDDWVVAEREHLRQLRLHALEALARALAQQGRYALAIEVALSAIALEPLRESAHRILVSLYLAEDNLSEAARHLRLFTDLLRAELGVDPSPRMLEIVSSRLPASAFT
jgi:DNA-binding SARP family transcriptional activator